MATATAESALIKEETTQVPQPAVVIEEFEDNAQLVDDAFKRLK